MSDRIEEAGRIGDAMGAEIGRWMAENARLRAAVLEGDRIIERLRERIHPTMDGYCPECGGGCLIGFATPRPARSALDCVMDCTKRHRHSSHAVIPLPASAVPEPTEPLTDSEAMGLIRKALDDGFVLDRMAGSVPIFRRPSAVPEPTDLRTALLTALEDDESLTLLEDDNGDGMDAEWFAALADRILARLATPPGPHTSREDLRIGLDATLFPHRGAWRHASWCSFERGDDTSCTCGLDYLRRSLNYEGDEPDARPRRAFTVEDNPFRAEPSREAEGRDHDDD